jgi:hypothetical protein
VPHTQIMTNEHDALPVLVIDGAAFSDFNGFARELSRLLCGYTWRGKPGCLQRHSPRGLRDTRERMGAAVAQL